MAQAIQIIRRDLTAIEKKVAKLSLDLKSFYRQYLKLLGESADRQLMAAAYQICTQAYPEAFLKLSFDERYKVQSNLKRIGKKIQEKLLSYCQNHSNFSTSEQIDTEEQILLPSSTPEQESSSQDDLSSQLRIQRITNPEDLLQWCKYLEQGINETLEQSSHRANLYLQQAQILPTKLPAKILEMALRAEQEGTTVSGSPNILNLLIEAENKEEAEDSMEDSKVTRITAVHLRLAEIEFADPTVSRERNQIRSLLAQLNKLRKQYHQLKRDYATAQAEAAWRSSWIEQE